MAETQNKLPITVDVNVSLSKAQIALGTDMTNIAFCTPNVDFLHGNRVQLFSTQDAFNKICTAGDSVWWAGNAFFSKTNRPTRIAVCKIFTESQPAYILSGSVDVATVAQVNNGAFNITIDGSVVELSDLDFSSAANLEGIASVINTALSTAGSCEVYHGNLLIRSSQTGSNATISYASAPESGTDVSTLLALTEANGASLKDCINVGTIADELTAIANAANQAGTFLYGWAIDSSYRDTEDQAMAAAWVNGRSYRACGAFATNNANAYDPANTSNNGVKARDAGYAGVNYCYDDNPQVYPDISYLANFLAVNYSGRNTTIAGKFKDADGISAVNFPNIETNVATLKDKRINTITGITGQNIKYFREGVQSSAAWSTDGWVNVCNFIAELEINILNVFLRTPKVAYTVDGQNLIISAAAKTCDKYKQNGAYADGVEEDPLSETGFKTIPAAEILIQELSATTAAQRAEHIGTPLTINLNDAGWMGSISVNVNVLS
jgi:hypothetical protein